MPRFGGPVVSSASSGETNLTSTSNNMSRVSEKVAHGSFIVICIYVIYIKCQDLAVQLSVVL